MSNGVSEVETQEGETQALARAYALAQQGAPTNLDAETKQALDVLIAHCASNRGVLSTFLTLTLKKSLAPQQDIRKHQAGMRGGFSARGLDSRFVTPFLRAENFPYMASGAGALTRSLEQAVPYDLNYPGKITPRVVRDAFLTCVDHVERGVCCADVAMHYLLHGLIAHRDRDQNLKLIKPKNRSIADVVGALSRHFARAGAGGSRLPVLALYAAYTHMVREVGKYRGCRLCDLQPHNAPDQQSGFLGDIQINCANDKPFEVVEVKHGIKLTPQLVAECYDKFKAVPGVRIYYLLSTFETIDEFAEINQRALRIFRDHGCQLIVNGIQSTLRYYLRMLGNTDNFVDDYVELVERECNYEIKTLWNDVWGDRQSS